MVRDGTNAAPTKQTSYTVYADMATENASSLADLSYTQATMQLAGRNAVFVLKNLNEPRRLLLFAASARTHLLQVWGMS